MLPNPAPSDNKSIEAWTQIMDLACHHALIVMAYGGTAKLCSAARQHQQNAREHILNTEGMKTKPQPNENTPWGTPWKPPPARSASAGAWRTILKIARKNVLLLNAVPDAKPHTLLLATPDVQRESGIRERVLRDLGISEAQPTALQAATLEGVSTIPRR